MPAYCLSYPLEDRGDALAAADTHRGEGVAAADALELVDRFCGDDGVCGADGVAEGDAGAVGVHLGGIQVELLCDGASLGREGFVGFDDVEVVHREAAALERESRGGYGGGGHDVGTAAHGLRAATNRYF